MNVFADIRFSDHCITPSRNTNCCDLYFFRCLPEEAPAKISISGPVWPGSPRFGALTDRQETVGGADDGGGPVRGLPGRDPAHLEDPPGLPAQGRGQAPGPRHRG